MNEYMAGVATARDAQSLYPLANRDEIKTPDNEPEFEGLEPLIQEAIRNLEAGEKGDAHIVERNLQQVEEQIRAADFLSQFMAEFKDAYYDARYSGASESCYEEKFRGTWQSYRGKPGVIRGPPDYWHARFYQAAFIHRTIPNPQKVSERISNPLFEASTILIQILKLRNFDSMLKAQSLLLKEKFAGTKTLIESFKTRNKRGGGRWTRALFWSCSSRSCSFSIRN